MNLARGFRTSTLLKSRQRLKYDLRSSQKCFASTEVPKSADAVVIGGGVVGTSVAYHLSKLGLRNVVLLERHRLTSGTTWHSAAMVNSIRGNTHEGELMTYMKELIVSGKLEDETGVSPGWVQRGGLAVTADSQKMDEFKRMHDLAEYLKNDTKLLTTEDVKEIYPLMDVEGCDILGGIFSKSDGSIDPTGLTNAFAKGAKNNGATIVEDCVVGDIITNGGRVTGISYEGGNISTNHVIIAAGCWSPQIASTAGVTFPLMTTKHSYVVTDIIPKSSGLPNVKWPDQSVYMKNHNNTLFLGAFEANPTFVDPDRHFAFGLYDFESDVFIPYLEQCARLIPTLASIGHRNEISGPESFTPDLQPLFGETAEVRGLYACAGMNSRGIQLSGGIGREMANLIVNGRTTTDLFDYDINRFQDAYLGNKRWLHESTHEAELRSYWIGFPTEQKFGGRNLRLSPLHETFQQEGAFFGAAGGWERPLFFMPKCGDKLRLKEYDWYGWYGHQFHIPSAYDQIRKEYAAWSLSPRVSKAIRSEVNACRENVGLMDLTSYGKLQVTGLESLKLLEHLCTSKIDLPPGSYVRSLMLNDFGGIMADVDIIRTSEESFYVVAEAPFCKFVQTWIRRNIADGDYQCYVDDVSDQWAVIGLLGPQSGALFTQLTSVDVLNFPEATMQYVRLSPDLEALAVRHDDGGETCFELFVQMKKGMEVYEAIVKAEPKIRPVGFEAKNSMEMETNTRLWSADMDSGDLPPEVGINCSLEKEFKGRRSVEDLLSRGLTRRLVGFSCDEPSVSLNGKETIYRNGVLVGYLCRGGFGYTVNKAIGFGYVNTTNEEDKCSDEWVKNGQYEVMVMGRRVVAHPHLDAIFEKES